LECRSCGFKEHQITEMDDFEAYEEKVKGLKCLKCGTGNYEITEKEDLIEVLVELAETAEARIEIISTHIEEGEMLLRSFGGIAAVTKYRTQ
jgi:peptide chain release factor subunit 1